MNENVYSKLEDRLGYKFNNVELLNRALTHKSFSYENKRSCTENNERLEFLGDAVLALTLSQELMCSYEDIREGDLSKLRASLVNEKVLSDIAKKLELDELILLGKGELASGGNKKPRLLASCLEGVLGAVFLDNGYEISRSVVQKIFMPYLESVDRPQDLIKDYKTQLQEKVQKDTQALPTYIVKKSEGPDHEKTFEVTVNVGLKTLASGIGKSKKQAEQMAAKAALENL